MSRTPAKVTQADVARCIRAARAAGGGTVEVRPDGTLVIHLAPIPGAQVGPELEKQLAEGEDAVL
jgi:hypothetical protein